MFKKASFLLLIIGFGLMSCSKDPISDLSNEESLVYITNHDQSANFAQYKTFSIVDSVLIVENNRAGASLDDIDRAMLQGLIKNMEAMGYKYVGRKENPDVGINVSWITNTYLNVVSQPLSSYYGGYWGGYGYGYPSYYSYYETSESSWLISMLDFKNPKTTASGKTFNVIWDAQIRGAAIGDQKLVDKMADSIFGQSGYLKIK
ncbi:MAG: hypothetical protein BGO21_13120 [Dyadobacter sp. 50-39]|uniref:DUF4136 domain-containing protein n=1 Tax=Dyadobacter sp. 50-39 TaxID=1895756 RepID=UPI00096839A6|nr:DUF4136 domain-containing protein [Dyadobacter sp. 50-39]OJV20298.1 MAG: hypothetical protein BGO21_13120 [Dyadobacter sp. 50-39]